MNWKIIAPLALNLLFGMPVHAQVTLFESDVSGIVPHVGVKWNQGIQEYLGGLEYTIDGRTTLGFDASKPVKDTLTFDANLKAFSLNPYAIFEFVEPDNLKTFSFAMRADFIHESTTKSKSTLVPADTLNSFSRTAWGGGPIFALRIFSSESLIIIPSAAYEFFYVTYHRDLLSSPTNGDFKQGDYLWHDVTGSCAFRYAFNEFNGISFEPKVVFKLGNGRAAKDLVNVAANFGYVLSF